MASSFSLFVFVFILFLLKMICRVKSEWQVDLGYMKARETPAPNFFISRLPGGTHVFDYSLFVGHAENFSNGITLPFNAYMLRNSPLTVKVPGSM